MRLKRLVFSLVTLAILVVSTNSLADPPAAFELPPPPPASSSEPDVGAAISPMRRGQIASFTGLLLSPRAVAEIVARLNSIGDQIKIEVERAEAEQKAKHDFAVAEARARYEADKKVLQVQVDYANKQAVVLNDIIKQQEANKPNVPLWAGLGAGVGLVVGVGLTVLTTYVVTQTSK